MNHACREFRSLLEVVLEGGVVERELSRLSWHEHLLACGECRSLLQAEEALEILLATLPEPRLPEHLARRVVSRLRDARRRDAGVQEARPQDAYSGDASESDAHSVESRLDALLELDRSAAAPRHLAQSLLARLQPAREQSLEATMAAAEAELDRLLELDRDLAVPRGLSERMLEGLRAERGLVPANLRSVGSGALDAAGVRRASVSRRIWQRAQTAPRGGTGEIAQPARGDHARGGQEKVAQHEPTAVQHSSKSGQHNPNDPPDPALLSAMDVLEQWDLLKSDDVDVLLSSSIGPADEALLEFQDTDSAGQPAKDKEPEPRSKG
jgi:hypothetical protein